MGPAPMQVKPPTIAWSSAARRLAAVVCRILRLPPGLEFLCHKHVLHFCYIVVPSGWCNQGSSIPPRLPVECSVPFVDGRAIRD